MKTKKVLWVSFLSGMLGASFVFAIMFITFKKIQTGSGQDTTDEVFPVHQMNDNFFRSPSSSHTIDFTEAAAISVPSVVHIKTRFTQRSYANDFFSPFFDFFAGPRIYEYPATGAGSGVIIRHDGYIITNHHVISNAEQIFVTLNDKREYDAELIGYDPSTDLALIKINEKNLPFLIFGDSDLLKVGEWVLAVGNPFNLTSTVTAGIVSAKARNIGVNSGSNAIESFIQTDAAVNRGNSGGALVNLRGELVGINTAIASSTGYYSGYSFAIPSRIVKKVAEDIILYGQVQRAYLGISAVEVTTSIARDFNIKEIKGLYIAVVEQNSAAANAGIEVGDILIGVNNEDINSSARLLEILNNHRPGDEMQLQISRKNKSRLVKVVLKGYDGTTEISIKDKESDIILLLGATFQTLSLYELKQYKINNGVQITKLQNGKLKQAGIGEGFIVTQIDGTIVRSANDIEKALANKAGGVLIEGIYPNGMKAVYGFGL
jgi:serine protease Do